MAIQVSIVMGSKSDLSIMEKAKKALAELGIESEMRILSAHRTPDEAVDYAKGCRARGGCSLGGPPCWNGPSTSCALPRVHRHWPARW